MKTLREQITGRCKHVTCEPRKYDDKSIKCKAGVSYYELAKIDELGRTGCALRNPCGGKRMGSIDNGEDVQFCKKYEALTEKEIQAELDDHERTMRLMMEGLSSCCEAPIDESQVIAEGQHKGHGPRFCSKCKKLAYMV
jgi:hypothetical protein